MFIKKAFGYIDKKKSYMIWIFAMISVLGMLLGCFPVYAADLELDDGDYSVEVSMTGGSGKASIETPTLLKVKDGKFYAKITWSSSNYDYMIVDGEKYLNQSEEEQNSTFEIPVTIFDDDMDVIADTLAMGTPHEVEYKFHFSSASIGSKGQLPQEGAKRVLIMAAVIIVVGGILNYFVQKRRRNDFNGK